MPELQTPNDHEAYQFVPAPGGYVNFKVRTSNDAHIALTSGPAQSVPMLEVFIGGWGNTKSIIRKNKTQPDVAEASTPGILSGNEFRGFWVRWFNGVITVGREGEAAAFMSYEDHQPFAINFAGFSTGWGATGSWMVEDAAPQAQAWSAAPPPAVFAAGGGGAPVGFAAGGGGGQGCWVPGYSGDLPPQAVQGGQDGGDPLFIARARHENALIPGKFVPSHRCAYVAFGGQEHRKDEYEVLCASSGTWVPVAGSGIPPNAVPAGESETGEPLFIGRASHNGTVTIGKVQPSHSCCYIPYDGKEMCFQQYEVFVA